MNFLLFAYNIFSHYQLGIWSLKNPFILPFPHPCEQTVGFYFSFSRELMLLLLAESSWSSSASGTQHLMPEWEMEVWLSTSELQSSQPVFCMPCVVLKVCSGHLNYGSYFVSVKITDLCHQKWTKCGCVLAPTKDDNSNQHQIRWVFFRDHVGPVLTSAPTSIANYKNSYIKRLICSVICSPIEFLQKPTFFAVIQAKQYLLSH